MNFPLELSENENINLIYGELIYETPVRLASAAVSGRCSIGAFSYCNYGCEIVDANIGRYCSIGQQVIIGPGEHPINYLTTRPIASDPSGTSSGMIDSEMFSRFALTEVSNPVSSKKGIVIGNDVWIGARVTILRGVSIGHGAIVAAGSVVTKDIEPYSISGGIPASHIRHRFDKNMRKKLLESNWWDLDISKMTERDYSDPTKMLDQFKKLPRASFSKRTVTT